MTNSKSKIVLFLIALVIVVVGIFMMTKKTEAPAPIVVPTASITGDTANLVGSSIVAGQKISGVQNITGTLKGGYFFEANARGEIRSNDGTILKAFPLTAVGDWMTADPVSFTATVDLTGVAKGSAHLRLMNDNPSGEPKYDKYIDIPIVIE